MPVYEYECKECGNRFEKMQPITADPLKECPHCGKSALRRVFHPVGVIFKGSGWYITDNRNSSKNSTSASSSDSSKADEKPASVDKAETKSDGSSSGGESSSDSTSTKSSSTD